MRRPAIVMPAFQAFLFLLGITITVSFLVAILLLLLLLYRREGTRAV